MKFGIATLFELTLIVAVCISLLAYVPPLGLMLPSVYVSSRMVARSIRNGKTALPTLMKTGAIAGVVTMYAIGALAMLMIVLPRFSGSPGAPTSSWLTAIAAGFVFGYGGIAAGIGALIGQWSGMYVRWNASRERKQCGGQ